MMAEKQREVNIFLKEVGLGVTEEFSSLLIDTEESPNSRFRHGFLDILAIRR